MTAGTVIWRVTWRRSTWARTTSAKSRRFESEEEARAFVLESLWGGDRPELGPLTLVRLERRPINVASEAAS